MRAVMALALVVAVMAACGGASSPPIQATPAVTSAPTSAPGAPGSPKATGGYDYGY